jgi:hypothetical protein
VVLLTGCAKDDDYSEFLSEYYNKYFKIAGLVELDNTKETLEKLHDSNSTETIKEIRKILDKYKDEIPKNKIEQYNKLQSWYNEMEYLSTVYDKWDNMDIDKRGDILAQLREIDRRRVNWNNKDSNIVWE